MTPALQMPTRQGLLARVGGSLVVAAVIVVCFVLPAEFHIDPTRLGQKMGLMAISQPVPVDTPASTQLASSTAPGNPARSYGIPFRSDTVDIPMKPDGELEYKVKMQPGGTLVYSWSANKGMVYYDFHGERPEDPEHAQSYGEGTVKEMNGSLIAPFAGIHGWFLQSQEGEPIVVRLKMSGFYELRDDAANGIKPLN
jgi:hypothetical protein